MVLQCILFIKNIFISASLAKFMLQENLASNVEYFFKDLRIDYTVHIPIAKWTAENKSYGIPEYKVR